MLAATGALLNHSQDGVPNMMLARMLIMMVMVMAMTALTATAMTIG